MAEITTRLIGSGFYNNGTAIAWPVVPWVVYDGEYTRPTAKKFRIVNQALYELDGTTPAVLPPSYVPNGTFGAVIYPSGCYYGFEIFQGGTRAYKGFIQVPYDPADNGVLWYDFKQSPQAVGYPTQRDATDPVKTYATLSARNTDQSNIIKGTVVLVIEDATFYGRTSSGWVPLFDSSGLGTIYEGIRFGDSNVGTPVLSASAADEIHIGDSTNGVSQTLFQESLSDGLTFADYSQGDTDLSQTLSDTVHIGDTLSPTITVLVSAADGFALGDATAVDDNTRIVSDGIEFSEQFTVVTTETFQVDSIEFGDTLVGVGPGDAQPGLASDGIVFGMSMSTKVSFTFSDEGIEFGDSSDATIIPISNQPSIADGIIFGIDTIDTTIIIDFDSDGVIFGEDMSTVTTEIFSAEGLSFGDSTDSVIT